MVSSTAAPADLDAYRRQRRQQRAAERLANAIPSEIERQAAAFAAGQDAKGRAAALLRHPDLAERLTKSPLSYTDPGQWNGFIPPRMWAGELNDSPSRRAVVEMCAEAYRREAAR